MTTLLKLGPADHGRRLTREEYRAAHFQNGHRYELIDGRLYVSPRPNLPHDRLVTWMYRLLDGYAARRPDVINYVSARSGVPVEERADPTEPEPDVAVVRGSEFDYLARHPGPADMALVVEVADSSVTRDRETKGPMYARAGIPVYWVVNVADKVVEVFTEPSGLTDAPTYGRRDEYPPGQVVPLVLDGVAVGTIAVAEVMA